MDGRARFTMVESSPTMKRLRQQIPSTNSRRRRLSSVTQKPYNPAGIPTIKLG
jgi:hypothetical protein